MLSLVHEITRKKASVTAAWNALLSGAVVPSLGSVQAAYAQWSDFVPNADDRRAAEAQHGAASQPMPQRPPTASLEAHIPAHQSFAASSTDAPDAAGPRSWKQRFWELHRELQQQDGQSHQSQPRLQQHWHMLHQDHGLQQQGFPQALSFEHPVGPPQAATHAGAAPHVNGAAVGNVVPFRLATAQPKKRGGLGGPDDPDPRPIVLFDLNGTLTSHTSKRRSAGSNKMRPGTPQLRRLQVSTRFNTRCGYHFCHAMAKTTELPASMARTHLQLDCSVVRLRLFDGMPRCGRHPMALHPVLGSWKRTGHRVADASLYVEGVGPSPLW